MFETIMFYIVYNKVTSDVQTMERLMYQTRSTVEDINMTKRKIDKLYKVLLSNYVKTTINRPDQIMRHIQKRDLSMIDVNKSDNNGGSLLSQSVKQSESTVVSSQVRNMQHSRNNETSALAVQMSTGEDLNEDLFMMSAHNISTSTVGQRSPRIVRASRRGKQSKCKTRDGCRHSRCRCRHKSGNHVQCSIKY